MKDPANPDDTPIKPEGKLPAQDLPSAKTSHQPDTKSLPEDSSLIAGETFEQVGASTGEFPVKDRQPRPAASAGKFAFLVGAGILISRLVGLIRQRIFAHYFGSSGAGDAFSAAFRTAITSCPSTTARGMLYLSARSSTIQLRLASPT